MVKEVIYYDLICDRCGKSLINESETCYPDTESAEMVAKSSGWITIVGKHYCPDCYELDEVTDEHVPKKEIKMNKKLHCGECEHFDLCFDPYRDSDGFCEITERPMDETDECNAR